MGVKEQNEVTKQSKNEYRREKGTNRKNRENKKRVKGQIRFIRLRIRRNKVEEIADCKMMEDRLGLGVLGMIRPNGE